MFEKWFSFVGDAAIVIVFVLILARVIGELAIWCITAIQLSWRTRFEKNDGPDPTLGESKQD
jgi:hypothetical protein